MLAFSDGQRVMIIKHVAAVGVFALTLSGGAPLPIGAAASSAAALVVTDRHWCRDHRYYRYDLEWHQHDCGGWVGGRLAANKLSLSSRLAPAPSRRTAQPSAHKPEVY